ncbi:MAG: hypothetical protein JNG89_04950 [Planctomycetaceae bacterium]|nr:hypothetical protein [Planctomycetaceae bacterium]
MKCAVTASLLLLLTFSTPQDAAAQAGRTYPRVYGPTGRQYGPTQAEYQYERQYGHSWSGGSYSGNGYANGTPWGGGRHFHAGSYYCAPPLYPPIYVGGYGYGGYGNGGFVGPAYPPTWSLFNPVDTSLPINQQAVLQEWLQDESRQWDSPLESMPVEQLPRRFVRPSTDAQKARSVRAEHEGDLHLQALDFDAAGHDYQDAMTAAQDRPDPYFRLAIVDIAGKDFTEAVLNLKLGLQLNADWPHTGATLDELLGEQNRLPKLQLKQYVLDWVQQDIRDPDRLFLLGVLLHMDNDAARAAQLFETAARLDGMKQHLHAFLSAPQQTEQAVLPNEPAPPLPQPEPALQNGQPLEAPPETVPVPAGRDTPRVNGIIPPPGPTE